MKKLLLAGVAALSLLSATSAHADELGDALKPFSEWLRWIDTNWLGSVWHGGGMLATRPWNGVWPARTVVLEFEPGGLAHEHRNRWINLAASGSDVEIRGPCFSACTFIVGYIPKERLCFGDYASLFFHLPKFADGREAHPIDFLWMMDEYPPDIRAWLMARGGILNMDVLHFWDFWELEAEELWAMGYRRCQPKPAPPMVVLKTSVSRAVVPDIAEHPALPPAPHPALPPAPPRRELSLWDLKAGETWTPAPK